MPDRPAAVVTGVSSFVGFHLADAFARAGWRVIGVHQRPRHAYGGVQDARLSRLSGEIEFRCMDIRDGSAITELIDGIEPELWIQHAGYVENYGSMDYDLVAAAEVNVAPLRPLYVALARTRCTVILTGSSMEYSPSERANREGDVCRPDFPYGLSKLTATLTAQQLALFYSVPTRVARLFIPFGPLDSPRKLIPSVAQSLKAAAPIDLSSCEQRRDFIAVDDVGRAYLALANDMPRALFDVFNISSGKPLSLKVLLLAMANAIGRDAALLRFGALPMRPGEGPVSFGDNSKAKTLLAWQPQDPETSVIDFVRGSQ